MNLTDLIGGNEHAWMSDPLRPCASPIDGPGYIRDHADSYYPRDKYYPQAANLCNGCPSAIKTACLQYALDNNEEHGIWGGTTPKERTAILNGGKTSTEYMDLPTRCRSCGKVYDRGLVNVVARYDDCSVWVTPCCGIKADDRIWGGAA